jgi:uncharacterized protein (TIGR04255 family)
MRRESQYPGFKAVLEKAFDMLDSYTRHFRPSAVCRMILSYFDIINIATQAGAGIELDDYFKLGVKLPENLFEPLNAFTIQVALPESTQSDKIQLLFATEPNNEENKLRFSMRWHTLCGHIDTLDMEELRYRLTAANERMEKCFFACFTEKGLGLFNPIGSD